MNQKNWRCFFSKKNEYHPLFKIFLMIARKFKQTNYATDIRNHTKIEDNSLVRPLNCDPFPKLSHFGVFDQIFDQISSNDLERVNEGLLNLVSVISLTHHGKLSVNIPNFSEILPILINYFHHENISFHNICAHIFSLIIEESHDVASFLLENDPNFIDFTISKIPCSHDIHILKHLYQIFPAVNEHLLQLHIQEVILIPLIGPFYSHTNVIKAILSFLDDSYDDFTISDEQKTQILLLLAIKHLSSYYCMKFICNHFNDFVPYIIKNEIFQILFQKYLEPGYLFIIPQFIYFISLFTEYESDSINTAEYLVSADCIPFINEIIIKSKSLLCPVFYLLINLLTRGVNILCENLGLKMLEIEDLKKRFKNRAEIQKLKFMLICLMIISGEKEFLEFLEPLEPLNKIIEYLEASDKEIITLALDVSYAILSTDLPLPEYYQKWKNYIANDNEFQSIISELSDNQDENLSQKASSILDLYEDS